jgi:uncharacterized coiled-coil DUF342 family protein
MRFKNNVVDRLTQVEASLQRIMVQLNRSVSREEVIETVDSIKNQIENIKELISTEDDEFAQQYRG